jgi:predicted SAM-dependent methyltransferase
MDVINQNNQQDKVINRYWQPNQIVIQNIKEYCETKGHKLVLEIGPGTIPFNLATHFIGKMEKMTNYCDLDIDKETIPYATNNFDFIYCRHVLEDIQNPDFALNEFLRVSKYGGYIETPSPLIEVTKNVDGSKISNLYCGYIHHRYIVWSSIEKNEIYFLPKYSCILDHMLTFHNSNTYDLINNYPIYWNNYFLFEKKPTIIMYKNGVNFNINGTSIESMVQEYIALIHRAVNESIQNTDYFIRTYR